jgi:hypothetical protein
MIKNSKYIPHYPEDKIIIIVEKLFSSDSSRDWADKISNYYAENEFYFLRDLYNKHKK